MHKNAIFVVVIRTVPPDVRPFVDAHNLLAVLGKLLRTRQPGHAGTHDEIINSGAHRGTLDKTHCILCSQTGSRSY